MFLLREGNFYQFLVAERSDYFCLLELDKSNLEEEKKFFAQRNILYTLSSIHLLEKFFFDFY